MTLDEQLHNAATVTYCSWCDERATYTWTERGWRDYACREHADQYAPSGKEEDTSC